MYCSSSKLRLNSKKQNFDRTSNQTLKNILELYEVKHIVGIGRFAENRAKKVVQMNKMENVKVHFMVHPSPASPMANTGWDSLAEDALMRANLYNIVTDK